jgi:hypothetical protein
MSGVGFGAGFEVGCADGWFTGPEVAPVPVPVPAPVPVPVFAGGVLVVSDPGPGPPPFPELGGVVEVVGVAEAGGEAGGEADPAVVAGGVVFCADGVVVEGRGAGVVAPEAGVVDDDGCALAAGVLPAPQSDEDAGAARLRAPGS